MALTKVPSEQLQFRSANTGDHLLDTYLEDAEIAGQRLDQLMAKLFNSTTGEIDAFQFTYSNDSNGQTIKLSIGGGTANEIASFTQLFTDIATAKADALAEMEVKRLAAATSESNAATSATNAATSEQNALTSEQQAAASATQAGTYAAQAFQTTPTVIAQGILLAQLHGGLFDGSTLSA
tara:strand:- start:6988 stop:7527 length:540 start_codon:yes stop_codon:yes gene_type:complete